MKRIISISLLLIILLTACNNNNSERKVRYNSHGSDEISIGVSYPASSNISTNTDFAKGLEFAINTINKNGGVLNKRLNAVVRDDENNANIAMQIAQTFCDQGITAVRGHWSTNVSYYAQDIYEQNRVVMFNPRSTGMILFQEKYNYVFRTTGSNQVFAHAVALDMAQKGFDNIAIFYSEDVFGIDLAKIFEKELNAQGIRVIDRVTSITLFNIELLLNRWNAFDCDAVIIASSYPEYVEPVKILRRSGSMLPIFGGDTLEQLSPGDLPGESYYEHLYVATLNKNDIDPGFLESFRAEYGHNPDAVAVDVYESITLLKDIMDAVKSIDSAAIAGYMSNLKDYKTVSGVRTYNSETQELDGYNVHIAPLKTIITGNEYEK
jgi:branched-chain amino acid transport system substrate-binding protein